MESAFKTMALGDRWEHLFWEAAPEDLIARILALLPWSNIYHARAVCKRWRSIIWSPSFMTVCKLWHSHHKPWLLEFQQNMYNQAWAYDLQGCQWFHLNFGFLPDNAILVAASGGLICLGSVGKEGYTLYITNPLTRIWKQLPSIPVQPDVVLLDVDSSTNTYKVVGLVLRGQIGSSRPTGSVLVFDLQIGDWKEILDVPYHLYRESLSDASVSGNFLYCLTKEQRLAVFDLNKCNWNPLGIFQGFIPNIGRQHFIDSSDGSYIYNWEGKWGAIVYHGRKESLKVFEFDESSGLWKRHLPKGRLVCAGRFSSVCFQSQQEGWELYLRHSDGNKSYTSRSGLCKPLPRSPLSRNKLHGREIFVRGFWFEPRIEATV